MKRLLPLSVVGLLAPMTMAAGMPNLPLPPIDDPVLKWGLALLATIVAMPATWFVQFVGRRLVSLMLEGIRVASKLIRNYVAGTPTKADDTPGNLIADALDKQADAAQKDLDSHKAE